MKQNKPTDEPADTRFFTIDEIAKKQRVSVRHVHRQIQLGKLRVHRFGKSTRVSLEDFREYLSVTKSARIKCAKARP